MQRLAAMRMQNQTGMATAGAMYPTAGSYFVPNPAAATVAMQGQRSAAQFMQAPAGLASANAQGQMRVPRWTSAQNAGGFS